MEFFDILNSLFTKTKVPLEDQKKISPWMLTLWVSHEKSFIEEAHAANKILFHVPAEYVYNYFFHKLPKGRRFIKWIKKKENKKQSANLEELQKKFTISKYEAYKFQDLFEGEK